MNEKTKDVVYDIYSHFLEFMLHDRFPFNPRTVGHYTGISHQAIYNYLAGKNTPNLENADKLLKFMVTAREVDERFSNIAKMENFGCSQARKIIDGINDKWGININRIEFTQILTGTLSIRDKARKLTVLLLTKSMQMVKAEKKTEGMTIRLAKMEKG